MYTVFEKVWVWCCLNVVLQESMMELSRCLLDSLSQEGLSIKLTGKLARPSASQLTTFLQQFRSICWSNIQRSHKGVVEWCQSQRPDYSNLILLNNAVVWAVWCLQDCGTVQLLLCWYFSSFDLWHKAAFRFPFLTTSLIKDDRRNLWYSLCSVIRGHQDACISQRSTVQLACAVLQTLESPRHKHWEQLASVEKVETLLC